MADNDLRLSGQCADPEIVRENFNKIMRLLAPLVPGSGDTADTNFAMNDLVADGDRLHDFAGFSATIKNLNQFILQGVEGIVQVPFVQGEDSNPPQWAFDFDGTQDGLLLDPSITAPTVDVVLDADGTDVPVIFTYTDYFGDGSLMIYVAPTTPGTTVVPVSYAAEGSTPMKFKVDAETVAFDATKPLLFIDSDGYVKRFAVPPASSVTEFETYLSYSSNTLGTGRPNAAARMITYFLDSTDAVTLIDLEAPALFTENWHSGAHLDNPILIICGSKGSFSKTIQISTGTVNGSSADIPLANNESYWFQSDGTEWKIINHCGP